MVRPFLALVLLSTFAPPSSAADGPVSFRRDVAPILVAKCLGCHGDKKTSGGLNMTTFAALRRGGKSTDGSIIEPGNPEASGLIESVGPDASPRMPEKQPPLSDAEIRTLSDWVKQGARFDGPSPTETPLAALVDPLGNLPAVPLTSTAHDPVTSLAFSPDGATLAVASGRTVAVVDPATGKTVRTLTGHPGPLSSVRFTPDGKTLIAAGGRAGMFGAVTAWEPTGGTRLGEARGHADAILAAEIAPDGRSLATAGYDRLVLLWDLPGLKTVRTFKDHTDAVHAVAFSPDGATLASAGADRTVKLWETATGRKVKTLSDATAELYGVAFSADGAAVFAGGADRSIRAWKASGSETTLVGSAFAHNAAVLRLAITADGKTLVSCGEDRSVKLWDPATLAPRAALSGQPDWPQAVAVDRDGRRLAVGRHDGSVALYDLASGKLLNTFQALPGVAPPPRPKPELVRNATLNPPNPRGAARGSNLRVTLTGQGVGNTQEVVFYEPGLKATIVPASKPDPNRLDLDLAIKADARVGLHAIGVVTPLGVPASRVFAVDAHAAANEVEPNDDPAAVPPVPLPATFVGTIDRPGDVDHFRFKAEEGRPLVFSMTAKPLGSSIAAVLTLVDEQGRTVGRATTDEGVKDPILALNVPRTGTYALRVADADFEGSGNHFYRIAASSEPYVEAVSPLAVSPGKTNQVRLTGRSISDKTDVPFPVADGVRPGTILEVPTGFAAVKRPLVVAAEGPQSVESEPNDDAAKAEGLPVPGGVSGRVSREGDLDHYRIRASKGERLIVEVFGRRLGTPVDPFVEILDPRGQPVPRAVLRPVAETEVAFRDHNSSGPGIRLTKWNNLAVNDTVLCGREVARIFALPRNPDDDCQFWTEQGVRVGFLETTPEHHPMGQPIYKVEVHPPGATFPTGGVPPVTLTYRNDDGGPDFGKDARVTFDPPADGDYIVRVGDARGMGGERFDYHLVVRKPRPDFTLSVGPDDPSVPRGSTALVTVRVSRRDGFDSPVLVTAEHLPPGITATPALVERGATTATLALTADPSAPSFSPPTWKLTARAVPETAESAGVDGLSHVLDPGGPAGGRITVTPEPNLRVAAKTSRIVIRAGGQVSMTLPVERGPAFTGRVPIEIRNLPHGVQVLDIGLNGVLVTETQTERTVRIYAEPWVKPGERPFYAVARAESAGTEHSSSPILLVVEPAADSGRSAGTIGSAPTSAAR